jgi:C1A family cysteine protease
MTTKHTDKTQGSWEEHPISAFGGHPLDIHLSAVKAVAGGDSSQQLADLGITDVEQLLALANNPEGLENLAATLGVDKKEIEHLVETGKKVLPANLVAELAHPLSAQFSLGVLEPTEEMRLAAEAVGESFEAVALPASVNLISRFNRIRNQGQRGTCVAFALTAINEYFQRFGRGRPAIDLSEQHLYHECKLVDGSPGSCGTWQRVGASVLSSRGECREIVWPYNPNLPCNNNGVMPRNARTDAANYKVALASINPATNVNSIKSYLSVRRPVGVSIPVFNSWYSSAETKRSGRITMPLSGDTQVGGHAICLVGYQDTPSSPGGGYFILRNSWNTTWAYQSPYSQGYGTIPYQYIAQYNWEAYTLSGAVGEEEPTPDPKEEVERTITITVRSNAHLIIE